MGRVRDFSDNKRQELLSYSDVNGDFWSFNWFTYMQYWVKGVDLSDDMSNVKKYHQDVIDQENANRDKINEIFEKVKRVDKNYTLTFRQNGELLNSYNTILKPANRRD